MLIEFSVKNYRSIRDEVLFSMVKGAGKEREENNVFTFEKTPAPLSPLLRTAAIYGPNAAGKTNLLRALATLQLLILGSAQRSPNDGLPVRSFALSESTRAEPTEFEIFFVIDKVRYQYGLVADTQRIREEWLYAFPKGRPQTWFQREVDETGSPLPIKFGENLKGEKELWERVTRPNASLLATAAQLNSEQLTPVFNWFATKLKIAIGKGGWNEHFTISLLERDQQDRILDFLKAADFAISDLRVREVDSGDMSKALRELPPQLQSLLQAQMSGSNGKGVQILTQHLDDAGNTVEMDLSEESDGTKKMFCFAGPWMDTLAKGNVMVIDELHDNLHPALVEYLVELFHDPKINKHGAQLIFSTHETAILNQDIFRRDQVWFCERSKAQATQLYPLSDFSVRKGTENLERGYLSGRYGALPVLRRVADAFDQVTNGGA